ncbi:MAG TPA: pilus assembly protein TadG-related protein [Thermomicrobiales bacterium]|jgi:Flp pilus assembly protein TadG
MRFFRSPLPARALQGQTLVLFALMSLTLIAGLGLVIDAGVNYAQRRTMQNAADSAALAGTRILSRQNTYPGTTRSMVWNAILSNATANGVANDPSLFQCVFIDNDRDQFGDSCNTAIDGGGALSIPSYASGVQVRVSETHTTFFMRALGTTTSGTSATSMAQVRVIEYLPASDFTLAVCGVQTATLGGGVSDILETKQILDWTRPQPSPSASPYMKWVATEPTTSIKESAYKSDWNSGNKFDGVGPTFVLYSPDIAKCDSNFSDWRGGIVQTLDNSFQAPEDGDVDSLPIVQLKSGDASGNTFAHSLNGTLGCQGGQTLAQALPTLSAGQTPTTSQLQTSGCVMLLPIVDNGAFYDSDDVAHPWAKSGYLRGRLWGAFYVFNAGGTYYGWLIKNYPMHDDGANYWSKDYKGPITVTLVKAD